MAIGLSATRRWILLLSVAGALRVFAFSAAYPVFDFIDEALHYDVVVKFAHGGLPGRGGDHFHPIAARGMATQGSEQLHPPYGSPLDHLPAAEREAAIERKTKYLIANRNAETFAPPVYYAIAGAWYRIGEAMGIRGVMLLYWLRFFNAPLYGAAIWIGCLACARAYPQRPGVPIAVGILMAVLPQDILYVIDSDVLCPLAMALLLYLIMRWIEDERRSVIASVMTGLAAAGAVLVKYTNMAALAVVAAAVCFGRRRRNGREVIALVAAMVAPVAIWLLRCQWTLGDWTAAKDKMAQVDWTPLTLAQSLHHPIFTVPGLLEFFHGFCVTFWRGELFWNDGIQHQRWSDTFYLSLSALGVIMMGGWLLRPSGRNPVARRLGLMCLCIVGVSILYFALLSTQFDYGHFFFPSRGFPYFAAGRFLAGSIVPVMILLAGGIDELQPDRQRVSAPFIAACLIAAVCIGSELYLCLSTHGDGQRSVFGCPMNWYHLIAG